MILLEDATGSAVCEAMGAMALADSLGTGETVGVGVLVAGNCGDATDTAGGELETRDSADVTKSAFVAREPLCRIYIPAPPKTNNEKAPMPSVTGDKDLDEPTVDSFFVKFD